MPVRESDGDPFEESPANASGKIGPEQVVVEEAPSPAPVDREPQPSTGAGPQQQDADGGADQALDEPLPEFDPQWRDAFSGLLFLGRLTKEVTIYGHKCVLRTLTTDEVLEIGLLHKPYQGSMGEVKAYQAAVCAGCVVSVDGKELPLPFTGSPTDTLLLNRFDYIRQNWFPPVVDAVYEQYLFLEETVRQVLERLGEAQG